MTADGGHDEPHAEQPAAPRWREALAVYLKPRVLIVLFLGFSAGPAAGAVRLDAAGVDAARPASISSTIGLFALVGTPYTIKFLWAPLVDALDVPVLSRCSAAAAAGWCSRNSC